MLWGATTLGFIPGLLLTGCVSLENDVTFLRSTVLNCKVKAYCGDQKRERQHNSGYVSGLHVSIGLTGFRY